MHPLIKCKYIKKILNVKYKHSFKVPYAGFHKCFNSLKNINSLKGVIFE